MSNGCSHNNHLLWYIIEVRAEQLSYTPTIISNASHNAVIINGATLFFVYSCEMPRGKDTRTSEKLISVPPQAPFLKI